MLQQLPPNGEPVPFQLKLPGGAMPLVGRARMVDSRKQVGNFRVSFAFVSLGDVDIERIEWALFDNVLSRLGA